MLMSKLSKTASRPLVLLALALAAPVVARAEPGGVAPPNTPAGSLLPAFEPDGLDRGAKMRVEVEKWEDRVRRRIESLDKSFQELDLRKIEVQKLSRERFEEILDDLEEESELILRGFADVQPDVKLLRQTLEKAPEVFQQISKEFEDEAAKTDDGFFRESYADLAAAAKKMAASCERKAKSMDALERELQAKLVFVKTSQGFCQHIRRFLRTIPTAEGIATEKWIERVNQYVAALEQSVKLLKTMTQGMDAKPTDPKPTPSPKQKNSPPQASTADATTPVATATPAVVRKPLTLDEARARLALLKK